MTGLDQARVGLPRGQGELGRILGTHHAKAAPGGSADLAPGPALGEIDQPFSSSHAGHAGTNTTPGRTGPASLSRSAGRAAW